MVIMQQYFNKCFISGSNIDLIDLKGFLYHAKDDSGRLKR